MKLQTSLFTLGAVIALCACDSKEEKAREAALERRADNLEEQAKATKKAGDSAADATKADADLQADRLKKEADARAEALKKEADRAREAK